jgi:hypothetical protein
MVLSAEFVVVELAVYNKGVSSPLSSASGRATRRYDELLAESGRLVLVQYWTRNSLSDGQTVAQTCEPRHGGQDLLPES